MFQNIVHILFSFELGGAELMLIDIMNRQVDKNNNVSFIIVNKYSDALLAKLDKRIGVHLIGRKEGSKNPLPIIKLNRLLKKLNPTVIHCHNANMIDLFWNNSIKKKALLTIHDTNILYSSFWKYKKLFSISKAVQKDIKNRYGLNSTLVYNGINSSSIKFSEIRKATEKFRIIQVSRLDHTKKGQDLLIKSLKEISSSDYSFDISIDFIGEGSSDNYLKNLVKELNLESKINFLGLKDRDYVYSHLSDYDLLVQPSLYEGFGLTIAEAMLAKVPVLVSNIDGPMEIINQGEYGSYFECGNEESLKEALLKILNNGIDYKKTEVAYNHAKANFDITNTVDKYLEEYKG